jgi:hypothetical protein
MSFLSFKVVFWKLFLDTQAAVIHSEHMLGTGLQSNSAEVCLEMMVGAGESCGLWDLGSDPSSVSVWWAAVSLP